MQTASPPARDATYRRVRIAVVVASVVTATVGALALVTHDFGDDATTRGVTSTIQVPGHPGWLAADADALWVALVGDPRAPAADQSLLRLDPATGTLAQTVHLGGEVAYLTHVGDRLIAAVRPVGDDGFGPRRLVALDWRSGDVLPLGRSHVSDADARDAEGPVDRVVSDGNALWALDVRPGRIVRLDAVTLAPKGAAIPLSSGRTLGLAAADGFLWVTAADAGEVLRIDAATGAITRAHVGGFPVGIVVTEGEVWFADRARGDVVRLDAADLRPSGEPIAVGPKPSWLAVAGRSLFVTDQDSGTVARIDLASGRRVAPPLRVARSGAAAVAPAVVPAGESVWVSGYTDGTVTRITAPASLAMTTSDVMLAGTGDGRVDPVTDGSVASSGRFTATGAVDDSGTYTGYRSVHDQIATVRIVADGQRGTITFVITIHLGSESPAPWTITSGTGDYAGVHGAGRLTVDNYERNPYTFVMKGTISH